MPVFVPIYLLCFCAVLLIITFIGFARQDKKNKNDKK